MAREPARIYIERMKDALKVRTDEELGAKLGYSKQAIANWRRRDTIPRDVSDRFADAFGPQFATAESQRFILEMRENEAVHAAALFAYERWLNDLGRSPTPYDRRAMGLIFPRLVTAIRAEVREIGFEGENSLSMIEMLTVLIGRRGLKEVEAVLSKAPSGTA